MGSSHPSLEERFLEPDGWQWHMLERDDYSLRYGCISPHTPDGVVVALPGLSEFGEKYFELARDCMAQNYAFCVIDWRGQGKSGRYLDNPEKRHGSDFQNDIDDFHALVMNHVKKAHPGLPLFMLAHSMGANIGLRYLQQHPDVFKCAALSAPLLGIHAIRFLPRWFALPLSCFLKLCMGEVFSSFHGQHSRHQNAVFENNPLSHDPVRFKVMNTWMEYDKDLYIGDVTFGWVYYALRSCYKAQKAALDVKIPCLIAIGLEETIVDNRATQRVFKHMKNAALLELPHARHEILMETDDVRGAFLDRFYKLINDQKP